MFESLVAGLLGKYLGEYFTGFDADNLNIGIWGGDVRLEGLEVKRDALADLNLPVTIYGGYIGSLVLHANWTSLGSEPVRAEIDRLFILAGSKEMAPYDPKAAKLKEAADKKAQLDALEAAKEAAAHADEEEKVDNSFTARLIAKIIDNLQVEIKNVHIRYEDSLGEETYAAGITLERLSAQSTDENWEPKFLSENAPLVHKLVSLRNLAIYFDTSAESLRGLTKKGFERAFQARIQTDRGPKVPHNYIMEPVSGDARIILSKRDKDFSVPKVFVELGLEAINFALAEKQYADLMELLGNFSAFTRSSKYRKFRPNTAPGEDPAGWWRFAIQCVKDDIHQKAVRWSPAFFAQRRHDRLEYIRLWRLSKTKKIKKVDKGTLAALEDRLSFEDIRYFRSLAEREIRREEVLNPKPEKTGWFGGWFGGKDKKKKKDGPSTSEAGAEGGAVQLTEEQLAYINSEIGFNPEESPEPINFPEDYEKMVVNFSLRGSRFTLVDHQYNEIMRTQLSDMRVNFIQRPTSMKVNLNINSFEVHDCCSPDTLHPRIVYPKDKSEATDEVGPAGGSGSGGRSGGQRRRRRTEDLLAIEFEQGPLDHLADSRVRLRSRPLNVVFNGNVVNRILHFFVDSSNSMANEDLYNAATSQVSAARAFGTASLQHAIDEHKTLDIDMDVQSPLIIIPQDCTTADCPHLVVDLGRLVVQSELTQVDAERDRSLVNEDDLYDRINVYISEVQILVSPVGTGWRNALTEPDPTPLHLLEKLSLDLRVEQCVVMNDPLYENLRVSGALPSLRLDVDTNQLLNLMAVVDTITEATNTAAEAVGVVPEDEAEDENEDGDEDGATLRGSAVVGINNTSAVANVDLETALTQAHEEKKKANEAATGDLSVVGESVFMRLNFEIQEIAVKLRSNYGDKDDDLLLLTLRSLQTEVVQRQFDTHVSVSLHRITGKDLFQQNGPAFENMIASSLEGMFDGTATDDHPGDDDDGFVSAESEEAPAVLEGQLDASIINPANHLIAIDLTMIQKDSPIFRTVHDSTLMVVGAHFRELHVQVNPETVAALLTFAGEAFPPKPKDPETEAEESDAPVVVGRTAEDIEAERVARAERAAKKAAKRAKKGKRSRLDKMFATMSGQKATQEEMEAAAREADRVRNAQRRLESLRRGSSPNALAGVDLEGLSALAKLKGLDKMKLPGTSGRAADENDADESAGGTAAATTSTDPMASSTLASSGGDEWFSCDGDEYTLKSMRVAARLDALSLTINRPGKKICRVAMEGVEVAMTQFTTTMHVEAALDKILVQDLTESGKEYRNIVDTAGTDPLISFEMQTFNHLEETGEPYPGYNTSIKANVQDLQVFFLNRFVGEMTDWAADVIPMMTAPLNKDEGDEAAKAAAAKKAEEAAANAPPADPEAGLLSLDIKMANLCVYVPQSSASKEVIKLDLGRIVVGNKIKKLKDKISVDITGMRLSSGTRGMDATFRDIIEPINFEVKIKRSLDTSIHDVEAMSVEIIITTISVSLTRSAYATVMALQAGNMTEISEAAQIKNAEIARTASNAAAVAGRRRAISNAAGQAASGVGTSGSQGGHHHHHGEAEGTDRTGASQALSRRGTVDGSGAGDTELHPTGPAGAQLALTPPPASTSSPAAAAANSGDETGETWTTMLVLVALHDITLKLVLEDETNASAAPSTSGMAAAALPDRLLAQLTFDTLGVNFEQFNDGSMSVDVGLKSIDILDCRPDVSKFPNLLSHTPSPEAAENELSVEFAQDAAGAMDIKVVLDRPRGVIVFDSLYAILDFVQPPEVGTPDSDEAAEAAAALAAQKQQVAADAAAAAAATADPYAKKAPISVQLNIVAPEFILVEDPASLGTRALVLDFDVAVEVLINEDGATNVRALIEHMEIFKCYLARREETLQFIVEPFTLAAEVNLENNRETGGADTDVTVDLAAIDIRVSYQDVLLALAILNTMTPPAAAAAAVKSGDSDAPAIEDAPAKTVAGQTSAGAEAEAAADAKGKGHAGIVRMDSSDFDLAEDELAAEAEAEAERAKTALRLAEAAEVAAVSVDDLVVDQYGSIRDADGTELLVPNEPAPANVETLVLSTGFIRLILINDRYPGQSTPLLNFRITSINVGAEAWSSALTVRAQLSIASDYYNPKLAVWEPMIEAETPEAIREQLRAARAAEYADGLPAPEDEAALADPDGESDEEAFGGSKGWSLQVDLATVAEPKVHQQIGVISTQVLNLNVTHTFMETLYLTTYLLGADYSKMQAARDSLAPEDMFMPYKLVNLTGHKLRFWLSAEDFYQVRSWEEQKFDYRDSAVVTAGVRSVGIDNPHYIVVQVAGGWDPVVRVPIDVVGTRAYTLQPLQDADQRLICDVELVDFVKVITVRTGVRMKNQTKMPLEVRLDVPNGPSRALPVLAPGSVSCVPITMAMMAHVRVRPVDGWHWSDEDTHWAEYEVVDDGTHDATATATRNKALGVQFMSCRAKGGADRNRGGGGGAGAMVASRSSNSVVDEGAYSSPAVVNSDAINVGVRISADFLPNPAHFPYPSHTYTFFTPLILENGLATGINVTLSQEAGTTRTGVAVGAATFDDTLASGAAVEVCELNLNHRITISVENDDFSCEEPALLFAARSGLLSFGANADKSMTLVNRTDGRELKINIERTLQDDGSQKVTVYAPFWIYNKTPFNLAYAETSLTSKTVAAGVPAEGVAPSSATPFQFFKTKAAIRVGGVEEGGPWSKSVSLAGAGTTGVLEVKGLGGDELPPAEPAGAGPSDGGAGVDGEAPAEEAPAPAKKDNKKDKKKKKKAADAVPLHEFSVSVELGTDAFRLVKKVTIENRYVFVNRTAEPMAVMQSGREELGDDGAAAVIAPGASLPFSWPSIEADRLVRIKFAGGEYDWSGAVDPSEVGFSNVKLRALDGFGTYIVNAEVKLDGGVTYVVLAPSSANPPIRIVNQTGLPLTYKQCGMDDLAATLEAGAATDYVWDDLSATRRLRCVFPLPEGLSAKQARKEETEYNLNDFAVKDDWILRTGEVIKVRVYPRGPTRVIRFRQVGVGDFGETVETDADKAARKAKEKSKGKGPAEDDDPMKAHDPDDIRFAPNIVVHATLAGIGLSIIDSKPRELLYVSLLDFDVGFMDSDWSRMIELKLKSLQIDNQMSLVQFPVMLCPTPTKIGDKPFLHLSVNIDNRNTTIDFYHYVGFMMQELDLKVEESLLMALLDFVWSMPQPPAADKPDAADGNGEGGENDGGEDGEAGAAAVTATPDSALSRQLYGDLIMLNPIQVNVSFATSPTTIEEVESGSSSSNPIAYIVRTLGVTLANIDNAPLKLNALVLENVFATQDELVGKIVHHYTMQGIRESYKILGSLDFLGNPVGLFNNVSTGVKDFFYEPAQGMVSSPAEFGRGLGRGTASLLKNTVSGIFNTTSKLTGTVSKGLGMLSFDEEYKMEREQNATHKPEHVGEGLMMGAKDLGKGVFDGVTGVFTQPIKGAKSGGVGGFFKGVGKGLVGVAVKPVAGVVDLATRTSEGIKNTATYFDAKAARVRLPRYFASDKVLRRFSTEAALGQYVLYQVKSGRYILTDYYVAHAVMAGHKGKRAILLSTKHLMEVNVADASARWIVPLTAITGDINIYAGGFVVFSELTRARGVGVVSAGGGSVKERELCLAETTRSAWFARLLETARQAQLIALEEGGGTIAAALEAHAERMANHPDDPVPGTSMGGSGVGGSGVGGSGVGGSGAGVGQP